MGTAEVDVFDVKQQEAKGTIKMVAPKEPGASPFSSIASTMQLAWCTDCLFHWSGTYKVRAYIQSIVVLGISAEATGTFEVVASE